MAPQAKEFEEKRKRIDSNDNCAPSSFTKEITVDLEDAFDGPGPELRSNLTNRRRGGNYRLTWPISGEFQFPFNQNVKAIKAGKMATIRSHKLRGNPVPENFHQKVCI